MAAGTAAVDRVEAVTVVERAVVSMAAELEAATWAAAARARVAAARAT